MTALLERVRRDLLHARDVSDATAKAIFHVCRDVGPALALDTDPHAEVVVVTPEGDDAEARKWMADVRVEKAWSVPLRTPNGDLCGRMLVAPREMGERLGEDLIELASDMAVARARFIAMDQLEVALRTQEELVRKAGEALVRDADQVVRALSQLERKTAETQAQLQQALRFQRAMLPRLPTDDRVTVETIYLPADVISGDFYDVSRLDSHRIRLFVADATGHGIAAGLATMLIKSDYDARKRTAQTPAELLTEMNDSLVSTYSNLEVRFSATCIDVHLDESVLRYSSAAHPPSFLAQAGRTVAMPAGGTFIGMVADVAFPSFEVPFAPGDVLCALTDGVIDAVSEDGSMFGEAAVVDALTTAREAGASPSRTILRSLATFVGAGRRLPDDATALTLSFHR